jgi:hypothetical protein
LITNLVETNLISGQFLCAVDGDSVAAATATTAVATATAAIATAAATVATATTTTWFGFVDPDHPVHPFDVLEIVDGLLLFGVVREFDKGETALASSFPIKGQAALAHFSVLTEKVTEILLLGIEREVAYVDCHVTLNNLNRSVDGWKCCSHQ